MKEVQNLLRIFEETKKAVEKGDVIKLRNLSDQTIHTISISQDSDNIATAVIIYSLSKIVERKKYHEYPGWANFYKAIIFAIDNSINALKNNNEKKFKENLGLIRKAISKLSGKLKIYIQDVFKKASINKASRIYEHGISMEKTAKLLGITMWELASYAGQTGISDVSLSKTLDVKSRIKLAMELFS